MKQEIFSKKAPAAVGPYSQAIKTNGYLFTSGQIAVRDGRVEGSIAEQTNQVMRNLQAVLEATNFDFSHVVKTTIYVTNMADYPTVNEVYDSFMEQPYPARETVGVAELPLGAKVEISMVAVNT